MCIRDSAYFVPFSGQEIYFSPEIIAEQEKSVMVKLMNFSNKVVQSVTDSSSLICHHVTMPGLLTNYISDLIEEHSIDMIAVYYTHLDVYKRQSLANAEG